MALEASICSVIEQVEGVRRNARAREEHWVQRESVGSSGCAEIGRIR
jgi:hypothetical protein